VEGGWVMIHDEAVNIMTKRGKVGNMSLLSAVRITLRAAYNHPSMEGTAEVQAARLLAKELGLTRFGEQKKAKDRRRPSPRPGRRARCAREAMNGRTRSFEVP
jgi:hypothetical protein